MNAGAIAAIVPLIVRDRTMTSTIMVPSMIAHHGSLYDLPQTVGLIGW